MIHTMTTAKWINPPSLEGRKGVVEIQTKAGSTVSRALSKADGRQPAHYRLQLAVAETWSLLCQKAAKLKTTATEREAGGEEGAFHVQEHGRSTSLTFYRGAWRRQTKDKPEDTTDHVTMETRTWKRTQGPLKVDELP